MRLSIRYWLRRWLVPELEPLSAPRGEWSGHEVLNDPWFIRQAEEGRKAMLEMMALMESEERPMRLH